MENKRKSTSDEAVSNGSSSNSELDLTQFSPHRRKHVAFLHSESTEEEEKKNEGGEHFEDHFYVHSPNQEPILHPIIKNVQNENEKLTARRKSMKVINEYLTEHDGVLKMEAQEGMGLFGPKFEVDPNAIRRNLFNQKRPSVFQHMARIHHKFGIRHLILVGLLALYSALGGLLFLSIEAKNELQNLEETRHILTSMISQLSQDVFDIANVTVSPEDREDVILLIREYYREMLKAEGKYAGSVYHKYERINMRLTWYYSSAVFYAMTLFTTIGYGTIATQTVLGKVCAVIYATIGIPLMLVVLSDVGRVLLRWFTAAYNISRRGFYKAFNFLCKFLFKIERDNNCEDKDFPLTLSVPIVIIYLVICSLFVALFDYHDGITPGLSLGDAIFISMSTIGLGDVMPNNIEYSPMLAIMFLFGLALLSVVNSTVYEKMERRFLYAVDKLEAWLENIHFHRHGREGYHTFKLLGPNIQLLALALPLFNDEAEEEIGEKLKAENTKLGQKIFSRLRTRTNSLIDERIDNFRPTLGIFRSGPAVNIVRPRSQTYDIYPSMQKSSRHNSTSSFCNVPEHQ
uniref:Potassium channel domain-containing protein n=1 Tax=Panagrolaimus sp. ES5 TaxID=591445 RepID=A0AC34FZK5_9BILA